MRVATFWSDSAFASPVSIKVPDGLWKIKHEETNDTHLTNLSVMS